jgi:hypothetical protein
MIRESLYRDIYSNASNVRNAHKMSENQIGVILRGGQQVLITVAASDVSVKPESL